MSLLSRYVAIVYKPAKKAEQLAKEASLFLKGRGVRCLELESTLLRGKVGNVGAYGDELRALDWVLVLGGDGTLLGASRLFSSYNLPILGINVGGLGFLTSTPVTYLFEILDEILEGRILVEPRSMVKCSKLGSTEEYHALNDVVIHKGGPLARIIDLDLTIDKEFVTTFRADGLIISTPTGSTAYNLSAGGPIVCPNMELLVLTPICPFTLTNRPIIVSDKSEIQISITRKPDEVVTVKMDGQVAAEMAYGDSVILTKSQHVTRLIRPLNYSFFNVLKNKLMWGGATLNSVVR